MRGSRDDVASSIGGGRLVCVLSSNYPSISLPTVVPSALAIFASVDRRPTRIPVSIMLTCETPAIWANLRADSFLRSLSLRIVKPICCCMPPYIVSLSETSTLFCTLR
jgi:hypothetical protein